MKEDLKNGYNIRPRYIDLFYNEIEYKLFNNKSINKDKVRSLMEPINGAYGYVKMKTSGKLRDNQERELLHLRETALITLNEFDNPNIEKIKIGLLHDIIEDYNISFKTIKEDFGKDIALAVKTISKENTINFLNYEELQKVYESGIIDEDDKLKKEIIIKNNNTSLSNIEKEALELYNKAKEKRNIEYFSRFKSFDSLKSHIESLVQKNRIRLNDIELEEITRNVFYVKLADRLHNLRTLWNPNNFEKIKEKIEETKKYFFKIIDIIDPKIKVLFLKEIQKLEEQFNNCSLYNEGICKEIHTKCIKILEE